jgi:hypothetical protein
VACLVVHKVATVAIPAVLMLADDLPYTCWSRSPVACTCRYLFLVELPVAVKKNPDLFRVDDLVDPAQVQDADERL